MYRKNRDNCFKIPVTDYGPNPFVINIDRAALQNTNYRTALWTGCHLQLTLMSIPVGGEIGLEVHPDTDQFIRLESGNGIAMMGLPKTVLIFNAPYATALLFLFRQVHGTILLTPEISRSKFIRFMRLLTTRMVLYKQRRRRLTERNIKKTGESRKISLEIDAILMM